MLAITGYLHSLAISVSAPLCCTPKIIFRFLVQSSIVELRPYSVDGNVIVTLVLVSCQFNGFNNYFNFIVIYFFLV